MLTMLAEMTQTEVTQRDITEKVYANCIIVANKADVRPHFLLSVYSQSAINCHC